MTPLYPYINSVVWAMARHCMPEGWDVSDDAPETFDALQAYVAEHDRICVSSLNSERTIFGYPETNWAFRAWHDWTHIARGLPFTLAGETETCRVQRVHFESQYRDWHPWTRGFIGAILECEVVEQARFKEETGAFPEDQRAFTGEAMKRKGYTL